MTVRVAPLSGSASNLKPAALRLGLISRLIRGTAESDPSVEIWAWPSHFRAGDGDLLLLLYGEDRRDVAGDRSERRGDLPDLDRGWPPA